MTTAKVSHKIIRHRVPNLRQSISCRVSDKFGVFIDHKNGTISKLNPAGTFVLKHIDGTRTCDEISSLLCNKYPSIARENALEDTLTFIHHLYTIEAIELR